MLDVEYVVARDGGDECLLLPGIDDQASDEDGVDDPEEAELGTRVPREREPGPVATCAGDAERQWDMR